MAHNDGKLTPNLGLGPGAGGTFPEIDEQNSDFFTLGGEADRDILLYDAATNRYVPRSFLDGGETGQILVKNSAALHDWSWTSLIDQGIYNLAQIDIDVPYTKVSNTEFRYDNADFTNAIIVNRRLVFQVGLQTFPATVTGVSYATLNTTVNVIMDNGADLPANAELVVIIGSTQSWGVTAIPEAGGENLNVLAVRQWEEGTRWMIGCSDFVLVSDDAGDNWIRYESFNTGNITALHWHEVNDKWYMGTSTGQMRESSNNGLTWQATAGQPTAQGQIFYITGGYVPLSGAVNNYIYIGIVSTSYPDGCYSANGGTTWTNMASNNMYPEGFAYNPTDARIYLFPSKTGSTTYWDDLYYISSAGGHTTIATNVIPAASVFKKGVFASTAAAFIIDENGFDKVWTVDDATPISSDNWTQRDVGFGTTGIANIAFAEAFNVMVAVGELGKIAYSPDFGVTWFPVANGFAADNILDVAFDTNDLMFMAIGQNGQMARSLTGIV